MVLRMMMRWAERRGFKVELLEASAGGGGGHQVGDLPRRGRERLRPLRRREGRAPARAPVAVRRRPPPPDVASPASRSRRSSRTSATSRSTTTTCRSTPTAPRAPAASTSTRPTRPCASPTGRAGIVVQCQNERSQSANKDTAMKMLRAKLLEREERKRREEIAASAARRRTSTSARRSAPTSCTRTRWSRTTAPTSRWATPSACSTATSTASCAPTCCEAAGATGARTARRRAAAGRAEQPTAPYLDAVVGYGFRGPGALPRPRPQGRRRAPTPGLRFALGDRALVLDIPQDIEGIDIGPVADALRARRGAGRRGLRRRAHVVPDQRRDAGQPRAVPRAGAARARSVVAQRNSHASLVDGLVLSGGMPAFVAPEYDAELGMAHGVTPERAARARSRATPDARAAFIVSPTYYGMAADVAALRRGRARGRRARWSSTRPGARTSASTRRCRRSALRARRRRRAHLHAQDRRLADPERDAARRATAAASTPAAVARAVRLVRSTSPSLAAAGLAGRRAPPAGRPRRGAAARDARGGRARARQARRRSPGARARRRGLRRAPGRRRATTRCGIVHRRARRPAAPATRSPTALRAAYDVQRRARDPRDDRARARRSASRPRRSMRLADDVEETVKRDRRAGRDGRAARPRRRPRCATRWRSPPRDAFLGRGRGGGGRRRGRPRLVRVDRRLPAGHPGAAARRAHHGRDRRLPARARRRRRAPARRERPARSRTIHVLAGS